MDENTILKFRVHAIRQMFARGITEVAVREALEQGEILEDYPNDEPFPSSLHLGWFLELGQKTPLHVVVSYDATSNTMYIVTAYQPDRERWESGYRKRKKL